MKIGNFEINKKIFITFIVIVVLTIIALILKKIYVKEYEDYKINKDKEFIYTYETYSNSVTEVPFVNIDTNFARELNDKLQELASTYKNSNTSNNSMDYRYNINDNIVSLVIVFKSIDSNNHLIFNYKTYVFDLDQEGRALTDEEILKKYGKELKPEERNSEYVGIACLRGAWVKKFKKRLVSLIEDGKYNTWWESVLYSFVGEEDIHTADVNGIFWSEVDTIDDYHRVLNYAKKNNG